MRHGIYFVSKKQYKPLPRNKSYKYHYLGTVINKQINCFGYVVKDLLANCLVRYASVLSTKRRCLLSLHTII